MCQLVTRTLHRYHEKNLEVWISIKINRERVFIFFAAAASRNSWCSCAAPRRIEETKRHLPVSLQSATTLLTPPHRRAHAKTPFLTSDRFVRPTRTTASSHTKWCGLGVYYHTPCHQRLTTQPTSKPAILQGMVTRAATTWSAGRTWWWWRGIAL